MKNYKLLHKVGFCKYGHILYIYIYYYYFFFLHHDSNTLEQIHLDLSMPSQIKHLIYFSIIQYVRIPFICWFYGDIVIDSERDFHLMKGIQYCLYWRQSCQLDVQRYTTQIIQSSKFVFKIKLSTHVNTNLCFVTHTIQYHSK